MPDPTTTAATREGNAVIHPGAVIFVKACKFCAFFAPDSDDWVNTCPDCGQNGWWRVEAMVQRVR